MKITPSPKLQSFLGHRYDVMIREEHKEKIAKSEHKKEKDKCRKKIERRFVDDIEKRTRALSLMNHIYKVHLKNLLDGLRVRSLLRYHLSKTYIKEVNNLLSKVDFNSQPIYFRLVYSLPLEIVKLYFAMKSMGSIIKQSIIRNMDIIRRSK